MVTSSGNVVSQKLVSHLTSSDEYDLKTKETIKRIINGMRKRDQDTEPEPLNKGENQSLQYEVNSDNESDNSSIDIKVNWLPAGWTRRDVNKGNGSIGKIYIAPDAKALHTYKDVISYMRKKNYSQELIDRYKQEGTAVSFKYSSDLPEGWMTAEVEGCQKLFKYLSPDGDFFNSRAGAIKFMIKHKCDSEDIEKMKSLLVSSDGWQTDNNLPEGWMKKQQNNNDIYMSPTFDKFRLKNHVLEFMRDRYSEEIVKRTEKYLYVCPPAGHKIKSEPHDAAPSPKKLKLDWKSDSSLPTGWLLSTNDEHVSISTPKDDLFHSRIEAIEHMIKQQQSPVDIFKLWSDLHLEGWHCDDQNLPSGWRRKIVETSGRYEYLSPLMEVITSSEEFLKHIERSSDYSEQDLNKARTWLENANN